MAIGGSYPEDFAGFGEFPYLEHKEFEPVDPTAPGLRTPPTAEIQEAVLAEYKIYKHLDLVDFDDAERPGYYTENLHESYHASPDMSDDIGKSKAQLLAEFEVGKAVIDRLRRENPDNRVYERALSVDVKTGELIYKRFRPEELRGILKNHPSFQTPEYQTWDNDSWDRYIRQAHGDLLLRPDDVDFYDVFDNTVIDFFTFMG